MQLVNNISWSDIWQTWQINETEIWRPFYEAKLFKNWADWRSNYLQSLPLNTFSWQSYKISSSEILNFKCGAFKGWLEASKSVNSRFFADLAQAKIFQSYPKIESIKANFPSNIDLIACQHQDHIYIIEGNHRCLSICQLLLANQKINANIQLALTVLNDNENYPYIHFYPLNNK